MLELLADFLATHGNQTRATIVSPSDSAITRTLDATPHEEQSTSIQCLNKIGELLTAHPNATIQLLWLPRVIPFVGFQRAKQLVLKATRVADLKPEEEPHTFKHLRKETKRQAVATWADQWHNLPQTSLAYRTALTRPPDGKTHPTFRTGKEPAKFTCTTSCTLYRLITGHAFIGAYTQCFYTQHTPEQIACDCSEPVQTVEHILLKCPNYAAACHRHLTANGCPRNLPQLFNHMKRVTAMLCFLEETRAGAKLRMEWEPG